MRSVADPATTRGQDGALDRGSQLIGLAATAGGDILVADTSHQRVLRIHGGRSTVLLDGPSSLASLDATSSRLLVSVDGGTTLAVHGLPAS
jgi:hypothetical protein